MLTALTASVGVLNTLTASAGVLTASEGVLTAPAQDSLSFLRCYLTPFWQRIETDRVKPKPFTCQTAGLNSRG